MEDRLLISRPIEDDSLTSEDIPFEELKKCSNRIQVLADMLWTEIQNYESVHNIWRAKYETDLYETFHNATTDEEREEEIEKLRSDDSLRPDQILPNVSVIQDGIASWMFVDLGEKQIT